MTSGELTAEELDRFRAALARLLGLAFDDGKADVMVELLERRASANSTSVASYLAALEGAGLGIDEVRAIATAVTVGETYFFRHREQLEAFVEDAVPACLAGRTQDRRLRIASLGCASGEEPFSLAMLLRAGQLDPSWSTEIVAIDVSPLALAKAARGRYTAWSLREAPPALRGRWFAPYGREHELDPSIRAEVRFHEANLAKVDPAEHASGPFDIVFCRNVLMYFTPEHARAVVGRIRRALRPGGFLFLGHAETLRGISQDFHLLHTHGAFYYRTRELGRPGPQVERSPFPVAPGDVASAHGAPLVLDGSASWVEAIQRATDRVRSLTDRPLARPSHAERRSDDTSDARDLLARDRRSDALDVPAEPLDGTPESSEARLLRAALLVERGDLLAAEGAAREILADDELSAGARYVLALAREASGDLAGALEHDRVAAYLDPAFAMPRLHLGLVARRRGELGAARVDLQAALDLLEREDPARIVLFGGGFGRQVLVALARAELRACGGDG